MRVAEWGPFPRAQDLLAAAIAADPERFRRTPVRVEELALWLGVKLEIGTLDVSGAVDYTHDAPVITLSTSASATHRRFTLAHELGHLILHKEALRHKVYVEPRAQAGEPYPAMEWEANVFASELLMPAQWVQWVVKNYPLRTVAGYAQMFEVSEAAMTARLRALGLHWLIQPPYGLGWLLGP